MSDERPDALLRSALEKIVYFEARSEQVENDLSASRSEIDRLKAELGQGAQREIELRRELAQTQVLLNRSHLEREEVGRLADALRAERAQILGKLIEASRIHDAERVSEDPGFDLASFISELRSEVLTSRAAQAHAGSASAGAVQAVAVAPAPAPAPALATVGARSGPGIQEHAARLQAQGRLQVSDAQLSQLSARAGFPGRTEETLFGFSVRELSSPDAPARLRAADRLRTLGTPASAPALATALHAESSPDVQVSLIQALAAVGSKETVPVLMPHLSAPAPDVRIAALKALIALEPAQTAPHLSAALKDPDPAVRRRASLLALGLSGEAALIVGEQAASDPNADVRSLAARVLGAGGGEQARGLLLVAMRDPDAKVRKSAAESLSRVLGEDVSAVVGLDESHRRREVRRLATLPNRPATVPVPAPRPAAPPARKVEAQALAHPAVVELPPAPFAVPEELCASVVSEIRITLRGRSLPELSTLSGASSAVVQQACELLVARGQIIRRGAKYFAA